MCKINFKNVLKGKSLQNANYNLTIIQNLTIQVRIQFKKLIDLLFILLYCQDQWELKYYE